MFANIFILYLINNIYEILRQISKIFRKLFAFKLNFIFIFILNNFGNHEYKKIITTSIEA